MFTRPWKMVRLKVPVEVPPKFHAYLFLYVIAGISVDSVTGTETSVFVGAFTNDFQSIANLDPEMPLKYGPTGNSNSILSNRVSWFYDLKGCSLTLDTACSSSLVAVHLAYRSIIDGNARMVSCLPVFYLRTNLRTGNCGWRQRHRISANIIWHE